MYKLIAICGKAGAGKDTILNAIMKRNKNLHKIISYTTRPMREKERHGVSYYFVSQDEFLSQINNGKMLEYTNFNDWYYGTAYGSLDENKINIGVFNMSGIKALTDNENIQLQVFYIDTNDKTRLMRQLMRETSPDVKEIVKRFSADEKDFEYCDKYIHYYLGNDEEQDIEYAVNDILHQVDVWA